MNKETLKEDYVSFEIAKLLKEKGFDWPCWFWYNPQESLEDIILNPPKVLHVMKLLVQLFRWQ